MVSQFLERITVGTTMSFSFISLMIGAGPVADLEFRQEFLDGGLSAAVVSLPRQIRVPTQSRQIDHHQTMLQGHEIEVGQLNPGPEFVIVHENGGIVGFDLVHSHAHRLAT